MSRPAILRYISKMTKALSVGAVALLLLVCLRSGAKADGPVVVELFTSEGCSSCPPADALLAELATRPEVLALSFHVDYWDRLGWKDPYSSPLATARQQRYAALLGAGSIFTPEAIVDGRWPAVGSDRGAITRAIAAAERGNSKLPIRLLLAHGSAQIAIGRAPSAIGAEIWLIGFDRQHMDAVGAGENAGHSLSHVNVVRDIVEVGRLDGKSDALAMPIAGWHVDRLAVLVAAADGHILGAAEADAQPP